MINSNDAYESEYRAFCAMAIAENWELNFPIFCPECDSRDFNDGFHEMIEGELIIGCEGFWIMRDAFIAYRKGMEMRDIIQKSLKR